MWRATYDIGYCVCVWGGGGGGAAVTMGTVVPGPRFVQCTGLVIDQLHEPHPATCGFFFVPLAACVSWFSFLSCFACAAPLRELASSEVIRSSGSATPRPAAAVPTNTSVCQPAPPADVHQCYFFASDAAAHRLPIGQCASGPRVCRACGVHRTVIFSPSSSMHGTCVARPTYNPHHR